MKKDRPAKLSGPIAGLSGASIISLALFVAASPSTAQAYIDPGTGATFVGSIAPVIIGVATGAIAFLAKVFWHPLRNLFSRGRGEQAKDK